MTVGSYPGLTQRNTLRLRRESVDTRTVDTDHTSERDFTETQDDFTIPIDTRNSMVNSG